MLMDLTPKSDPSFMSWGNDRHLKQMFGTRDLILALLKDLVFSHNNNKLRWFHF